MVVVATSNDIGKLPPELSRAERFDGVCAYRTTENGLAIDASGELKNRESLDVVREAGTTFDAAEYLAGRQTPVFFGSALTNFGLEPFLQAIIDLAPDLVVVNDEENRWDDAAALIDAGLAVHSMSPRSYAPAIRR